MDGGGQIFTTSLDVSQVLQLNFGSGTITVNGGAFSTPSGEFDFGSTGSQPAVVKLINGASLANSAGSIHAGDSGTRGTFLVSGGGVAPSTGGEIDAGYGTSADGNTQSQGTLSITGGSVITSSNIRAGVFGGVGTVTVDTGSTITLTGSSGALEIGSGGGSLNGSFVSSAGTLSMTNGAQLASPDGYSALAIGESGGNGTASIDGATTRLTLGTLQVGYANNVQTGTAVVSHGVISLTNGAQATITTGFYDGGAGGIGTISVNGSGSSIAAAGTLGFFGSIGAAVQNQLAPFTPSTGALNITNAGVFNASAAPNIGFEPEIIVGSNGGCGTINVAGSGSSFSSTLLTLGEEIDNESPSMPIVGRGLLSISGGASANVDLYCNVGDSVGVGTISVDGAGSSFTVGQNLDLAGPLSNGIYVANGVSYFTTGAMNLTNGASVTIGNEMTIAGDAGRASATVNHSTLKINGALTVGSAGGTDNGYDAGTGTNYTPIYYASRGTLAVSNGGTLITNSAAIALGGGQGTVTLDGVGTVWNNQTDLSISDDSQTSAPACPGLLALSNHATLNNGGVVTINSLGTITIASGATLKSQGLEVAAGDTSSNAAGGQLTISDGTLSVGTMQIDTSSVGSGNVSIGGTAYVSVGTLTNYGAITLSGGTVKFGAIEGTGGTVTTTAGGNPTVSSIQQQQLSVASSSTVTVAASSAPNSASATSKVTDLSLASNATVDLTNNSLIVDPTTDTSTTYSSTKASIAQAYDGGKWDKTGLTSSLSGSLSNQIRLGLRYRDATRRNQLRRSIGQQHGRRRKNTRCWEIRR